MRTWDRTHAILLAKPKPFQSSSWFHVPCREKNVHGNPMVIPKLIKKLSTNQIAHMVVKYKHYVMYIGFVGFSNFRVKSSSALQNTARAEKKSQNCHRASYGKKILTALRPRSAVHKFPTALSAEVFLLAALPPRPFRRATEAGSLILTL